MAVALQREVPESYARGGGHSSFPAQGGGGGEPPPPSSDSPWSSPPPGTPVAVPQPKRKRGRPRKAPGTSSISTQSSDPSSDTDVYCFCRRPDRGRLMVQCDQCDGWFHGECMGVTTQEVADLDQYICPACMGDCGQLRCLCLSFSDSPDEETFSYLRVGE